MFEIGHALVLGSGSPRRREMLEQLGLRLIVDPPHVDESYRSSDTPLGYVQRIAREKLETTLRKWQTSQVGLSGILCADTVVCVEDEVLQKPRDVRDAEGMLNRLMGCEHRVMTAYALWGGAQGRIVERVVTTTVVFRHATRQEIVAYARSGEGLDKAGAYAVQGLGSVFVERIDGSYSNVVGLPLCTLFVDLVQLGIVAITSDLPK